MVTRAGVRPDHLLLFGGFGSSAYLQLKLENRFGERNTTFGRLTCIGDTLTRSVLL
jgi:hypothetical protein